MSARVVTAAALIMASVFIVRLALVPAVMAIAGKEIWYHPKWYGRLIPDPDIEGEKLEGHLDQSSHDKQLVGTNV
ncbi:hypothetical protein [Streptomyces brevispora]|uniref:MMPL family protein n=1 Tax=Streptomyces brevispora TaxID=887462 RepID=A0ABZ1G465_9ACTN|nr:hypothetical protein [Streptomyces brevispora]WSC13964.1 hypothetical protein OIE64_14660 [Streptomyces brevispora]